MERFIRERHCLEAQFGYIPYHGRNPRLGWLLNYNVIKNELTEFLVNLYFVDETANNFKITIPYYPSFLVETGNDPIALEEYFMRKYEGAIFSVESTTRIDVSEHNHLNKPPKEFLKFYCKKEIDLARIVRDFSGETTVEDDTYRDFGTAEEHSTYKLYEHDIPTDVQVGNALDIRCGIWYEASYDGSTYKLVKNSRITYPELRIFAFDIETTKPPLKFPNPENDAVMMISIMTGDFGELIINREIVSEDIKEFEYIAKEEMGCRFRISNEMSEEELLIRFIEIVQLYRPHVITTYNGGFFDWPFVEKRASKYSLSISDTLSISFSHEYYDSPFLIHLDCYKWVQRDSYLPMNNQGLKDATRIKLGYFPEEIDPEDMVRFARENPQKLASYSVSDAVATYYLYIKYVQPHIFSISSIIPLPTVQILCRGSGTLCEAVLFSESINYNLLVPSRKRSGGLEYSKGHIVEHLTYVGGHVESLRAGVFRSDFIHKFNIDSDAIDLIIGNLDELIPKDFTNEEVEGAKKMIIEQLNVCRGEISQTGAIYHLDVGAMYPNIILTNRMQPIAVVNEDVCIHCDFNKEENHCKRKMAWVSRSEYLPPHTNEINMIKNQLKNETFYLWKDQTKPGVGNTFKHNFTFKEKKNGELLGSEYSSGTSVGRKVPYSSLPQSKQESILKERVTEYSRKIYKKVKKIEVQTEELTLCQREVPFYVETVRKFRDQRNVVKGCYKKALNDLEKEPSEENKKKVIVYNSLQVAYKVVLNSFYGYVMRVGSRWFSLEMAAAVCHVGGKIIRSARELIELIGIALELDTDGIWCCLPSEFPSTVSIGKRKFSLIGNILNYFVCKKFTNYQYQTSKHDANGKTILGEYEISAHNSIMFEVDGPYKAMVIPSSTEENRLLKKRYAVFDDNGKITELKGFELKRRGELNIVKKFQEDLFCHFNDGRNLQECYDALAMVCNYWLDIIYKEGGSLDEETVFELFSESRNMSKSLEGYGDRKSNIMSTAKKLSEFLGADILEDKLKCEFIISKYPENAPTAERCIPVLIFKHQEKEKYLKRWLQTGCTDLKKIIDWNYYKRRFEAILQRMVVIPAYFQNISNPVKRVEVPSWIRSVSHGKLDFKKTADIEDLGRSKKKNFADMFYNAECSGLGLPEKSNGGVENDLIKEEAILDDYGAVNEEPCQKKGTKEIPVVLENIKPIIENNRESWLDFYNSRSLILFIDYLDGGSYKLHYFNGSTETVNFTRKVYLEVNDEQHFTEQYEKVEMHLPDSTAQTGLYIMKLNETESKAEKYRKFFEHFSIRNSYNLDSDPFYQLIADCNGGPLPGPCVFISSVIYQRCLIFCITSSNDGTIFISEKKVEQCVNGNSEEVLVPGGNGDVSIAKYTLDAYRKKYVAHVRIISYNGNDPGADEIVTCFKGHVLIRLDLTQTVQLEKIESRLGRQYDLHLKMREEYQKLMDISSLFNIPVKNITPEILEFAYYKEMYGMGFLCLSTPEYSYSVLKDEIVRPGYYPTYTVMLECVSSLLLAIIEYDSVIGEDSLFDGLKKYEFIALREFVRKIVVSSLKGNVGASSLVEKLNYWLKKGSNLISVGLRDLLIVLQQKYLITFVQKLKELQCKIIYVSREIILIDTGKGDLEGCNLYIQYLKNKVNAINGYELLNLEPIRYFEKLGFTGPACYFFVKDGKTFSFSDTTLPMSFCDFYFSGAEITNDQIYAMMPNVNIKQARLLLRLLSYKRDVHGLASNCYRLLRAAETGDSSDEFQSNLTVFCKHCMAEVLMRKRCIRCYEEMEQEYIEEECLKYLYFLWRQQASGDRACNACGAGEERRLKDYCRCGGRFILKNHMKELEMLRLFVNSRKFDNEVNMVNRYFNYK